MKNTILKALNSGINSKKVIEIIGKPKFDFLLKTKDDKNKLDKEIETLLNDKILHTALKALKPSIDKLLLKQSEENTLNDDLNNVSEIFKTYAKQNEIFVPFAELSIEDLKAKKFERLLISLDKKDNFDFELLYWLVGSIYFWLKNYNKAKIFFINSIKISENINNLVLLELCLPYLINTNIALKQYDEAFYNLKFFFDIFFINKLDLIVLVENFSDFIEIFVNISKQKSINFLESIIPKFKDLNYENIIVFAPLYLSIFEVFIKLDEENKIKNKIDSYLKQIPKEDEINENIAILYFYLKDSDTNNVNYKKENFIKSFEIFELLKEEEITKWFFYLLINLTIGSRNLYINDNQLYINAIKLYSKHEKKLTNDEKHRLQKHLKYAYTFPLTQVEIKNYRLIKKSLTIDLLPDINIFLAKNGHGKTTILQALALSIIPERDSDSPRDFENYITNGETQSEITANWFNAIKRKVLINNSEKTGNANFIPERMFLGYGSNNFSKYNNVKDNDIEKIISGETKKWYYTKSLFGDFDDSFYDPLEILDKLEKYDFDSRFSTEQKAEITEIKELIIENLNDLIEDFEIKKDITTYYFYSNTGEKLLTKQLSDGYKSAIFLHTDILIKIMACRQKTIPKLALMPTEKQIISIKDTYKNASGIIAIDEFDRHLHPSWQQTYIEKLRKVLPKIQFVLSTHSPVALAGLDRNQVNIIELKNGEVSISRNKVDLWSWTYQEILSRFYKTNINFKYTTKELNEDLEKLQAKKDKTKKDEEKIISLKDNLKRLEDSIRYENEVEELKRTLQEKYKELDEIIEELN